MEDRLLDLSGIPDKVIAENNLEFLLDDEYIVPEGIFLYEKEIQAFKEAHEAVYVMFREELENIVRKGDFGFLGLPNQMIDLVKHSVENKHMHLLGRFDFAGGIDDLPIKLLEFNADMPTLLPESIIIQQGFNPIMNGQPYSELVKRLEVAFNWLSISDDKREKSMLGTSFGHEEDVYNVEILLDLAQKEGFDTFYADLPRVEFAKNEGVFVELEDQSSMQFDYLLKLVPWEFACFEEPEFLDDLHNLILNDLLYVLNPAHAIVYQSKAFLVRLAEKYPSEFILKASRIPLRGTSYVRKACFGRLGENISIHDTMGRMVEETGGDLDMKNCIYQEFAKLYVDNEGEYYQPGVYNVNGAAAGISFRRAEKMIVDNDCQFIPHIVRG